ncbi:MAG: PAS domain S-box protein [Rubrivivax sp.]|nr:MAG: PAS domain S-box protein [Rubrivivax sp.]
MDVFTSFLGRSGYLPHGYCFTWTPALLWTMVVSDAAIALAYFSIPVAITSFLRKRRDVTWGPVAWLFSAFIFSCGITHVMDIWTVWQPDYGVQALTKAVTAAFSVVTAVALWPLIPVALKIPSTARLQAVIAELEAEVRKRRGAEEHLVDVQQSLAVTLASIGAGFIATDREGRVSRMNAVAEQLLGWSQAEAQGQSLWTVLATEGRPDGLSDRNPIDVMIEQGVTIENSQRVVVIARDGRRTTLELKAALMHGADSTVRGLTAVFRDMAPLLKAEAEASRLAAIVESSSDAIIGKTLQGQITSWNGAAQALFGYSAEQAIGQRVDMLLPPDHVGEEAGILRDLSQGIRVPPFDTVRLTRDGRRIDVSVTISPILDARGQIIGASKIARDVSQQRRAEAALLKAERLEAENRQIQEASRVKSLFLANMSHELRTPLNAIIGFADLLHSGAVPHQSPKHQDFLGHIATAGRHLLQLINDVLDLSKVESGKFEFFPEAVHLPGLIGEVQEVLLTAMQRKQLSIEVDIDPAVNELVVDPARLKQVLYNYLSNAIKFTPEGGQVRVRALPEGDALVRIEVEDNGIGISEDNLPRLFTEFQQLDAGYSKQHQGTGLGLALTRRLVQAQGGSVGVRSTPGQGSVFHLVLPRLHRPDAGPADTPARALVIEPEGLARTGLVAALNAAGFEVDTASTGHEALAQACGQQHYDALTLDLLLPDQRGLGVLAGIRSQGPNHGSPVVGVAMSVDDGAAAFAIADVLTKPIRSDEVAAAMARFLQDRGRSARVMVIDDDPVSLDLMRATLATLGIEGQCFTDPMRALLELEHHRPDAIILDLMMPVIDGFEVLDALNARADWSDIPVFVWTSMILTEEEYDRLARSARIILGKGGGALAGLLDQWRHWRPAPSPQPLDRSQA